jgi:hypothetical protein
MTTGLQTFLDRYALLICIEFHEVAAWTL